MAKIALVTDSTGYIPQDLVDKYHITVAPQVLIWGQETFEDGVSITPTEFYTRLKKATVMPTSSQATVAKFQTIFQSLLNLEYEVLAMFRSEVAKNNTPAGIMVNSPAIAAGHCGKGRVLFISPHPEQSRGMEDLVCRAVLWAAGKK